LIAVELVAREVAYGADSAQLLQGVLAVVKEGEEEGEGAVGEVDAGAALAVCAQPQQQLACKGSVTSRRRAQGM